jgi:hypothetical protein
MSCEQKISKRVCIPSIKYNPIAFKIVKNEIDNLKPPPQPIGSPFYKPIVLQNFSCSSIKSLSIKRKRNMFSTIKNENDEDQDDDEDDEDEEELVRAKRQKINQKSNDVQFLDFINLFQTSEFNQLLIEVGFPKTKEITQNTLHQFLTL